VNDDAGFADPPADRPVDPPAPRDAPGDAADSDDRDATAADAALIAELRRVAGLADPLPDDWAGAARAAFGWARLPGVPARLTYDSLPVSGAGASDVALGSAQRILRFTARATPVRVGLEVEVDTGADKLRLVGRLWPARRAPVEVVGVRGRTDAEADGAGLFHVDELPRAPFCLLVGGSSPIKTGWIVT
jgi:hypothetical protein